MSNFLSPLDNILEIVKELTNATHSNRRGSTLENAFYKITAHVNEAKNNIITHLLDRKDTPASTKNFDKIFTLT